MRLDRLPASQMINLFLHLFEEHVMQEKEYREARERVRAEMRQRFSRSTDTRDVRDDDGLPRPQTASGPLPVKPYIPPTVPNENNPSDPFGLGQAPLG